MEKDIKILENVIVEYSTQVEDYKYYTVPVRLDERDIQAIENLIKRNKELEEKDKYYNKLIKLAQTITDETLKEALEEFEKDYIPKSKIKEIRDKAEVMDYYTLPDVIEDLNKLLEEE